MAKRVALALILAAGFAAFSCASGPQLEVEKRTEVRTDFEWQDADKREFPPYKKSFLLDRFKAWRAKQENPPLMVGAAKVDITPLWNQWLAGFGPNRMMSGVFSRIYATTLFIDDGKNSLVLTSCDLIGFLIELSNEVRPLISAEHQDDIILAATHSHAAPDTLGIWGPAAAKAIPVRTGKDPRYWKFLKAKIVESINEAISNARPARLKYATVTVPEGVSKNIYTAVRYYKDDLLTALKAEDEKGENIATLVNYSMHPEILSDMNTRLSADWPGFMYESIERNWGGVSMLVSGDLGGNVTGDINRTAPVHEKEVFIRKAGYFIADLARQALDERGIYLDKKRIEHLRAPVEFDMESDAFKIAFKMKLLTRDADMIKRKLVSEVHVMRIGELAFVTAPGEIFPSLGKAAREAAAAKGAKALMIVGLAPEELAYMMTPEEFVNPVFAYDAEMSLGKGAGEAWLNAVKKLMEKLGD
jgi:hypothetical protein